MRDNCKTGKEFELRFLHELYEYMRVNNVQCDVFQPLVDDNGIDCIIRTNNGEYREIQIKARTKKRPFTVDIDLHRHRNYWLILYYDNHRYILDALDIKYELSGNHINIAKETDRHREYKQRDFDDILRE